MTLEMMAMDSLRDQSLASRRDIGNAHVPRWSVGASGIL